MQTLDIHTYDGKLQNTLRVNNLLSITDKKTLASTLITPIQKINLESSLLLSKLISDIGTGANYDPTNKISADDLLVLCSEKKDSVDFIQELIIQLQDMKTGMCSQGRTHRLYQLILAFP